MTLKFSRHQDVPIVNCSFLESGWFWKMQIREWTFAQFNIEGADAALKATSNNPGISHGFYDKTPRGVRTSLSGTTLTVKFFAEKPGFTFIQPFTTDPFTAAEGIRMQVEVLRRRADNPKAISLTKLLGSTVVITAPDIASYEMNKTITFKSAAVNPVSLFSGVPDGADHVVICSHGGVPTAEDKTKPEKICLFVAGFKLESIRIDVGNAQEVFQVLKGKVAENCVIWFGGCTIGQNAQFCQTAANASGCTVVAPVMVLTTEKYPKGTIDILDGFAIPRIFAPGHAVLTPGETPKMGEPAQPTVADFCAEQERRKFVVPV